MLQAGAARTTVWKKDRWQLYYMRGYADLYQGNLTASDCSWYRRYAYSLPDIIR